MYVIKTWVHRDHKESNSNANQSINLLMYSALNNGAVRFFKHSVTINQATCYHYVKQRNTNLHCYKYLRSDKVNNILVVSTLNPKLNDICHLNSISHHPS